MTLPTDNKLNLKRFVLICLGFFSFMGWDLWGGNGGFFVGFTCIYFFTCAIWFYFIEKWGKKVGT
jgi:hypothetical protein